MTSTVSTASPGHDRRSARQRRRQSTGCEGNGLPTLTATEAVRVDVVDNKRQLMRVGSRDDDNDTIVGSNGFVCSLKQQSTNEGGEGEGRW
jgi:hypothetical protein